MNDPSLQVQLPTKDTLTAKDLYEQGSKCCQQYSQLTMQVRTLAQHVMIAYAVGLGLFFARYDDLSAMYPGRVLVAAGIILIVFASVLCLLNLHHSNAFRAIRDYCLVPLEEKSGLPFIGPWQAHQGERTTHKGSSRWAWYSPFLALGTIGLVSFDIGIWLASSKRIVVGLASLLITLVILWLCYRRLRKT
jgi:hypothetical protein